MGARCQSGCGEKENPRTRRTMTASCRNREVPETGTLRGVGGEAFLPYPIMEHKPVYCSVTETGMVWLGALASAPELSASTLVEVMTAAVGRDHRYHPNAVSRVSGR